MPTSPAAPPLDPSSGEARRLLADELAKAEYSPQESLLRRAIDVVVEWFTSIFDGASGGPLGWWWDAMLVLVLLGVLGLVAWTLLRLEPARRTRRSDEGGVFEESGVTAAQYRARARAALARGDHAGAAVDGYRALAREAVERFVLDDLPGSTAREIAVALTPSFPEESAALAAASELFGAVRYGGRAASAEQAEGVLALDARLREASPALEELR